MNLSESYKRYDIKGPGTIYRWIKKMGKNHLLNKIVRIETMEEKDQLKFQQEQIRELKEAKRAAQMFIKLLHKTYPKNFAKNTKIIHHSDHGSQYCSYIYTELLKEHHILISIGKIGNCYENAMAESMNSILKNEFEMGKRFVSKDVAHKTLNQAIDIYNNFRPHGSLKMATPMQMFKQNVPNPK